MEKLFSSFIHVLRKLDDAAELLATFQELKSNLSATSTEDRVQFLNFPDVSTQEANIAAATILSKGALFKKKRLNHLESLQNRSFVYLVAAIGVESAIRKKMPVLIVTRISSSSL
jgi:hypothetical protein